MNRYNFSRAARGGAVLLLAALAAAYSDGGDAPSVPLASARAQAQPAARSVAIARGKVEVQGGLIEMGAPVDGTVDAVEVQEGEHVRKGQALLRLDEVAARRDAAVLEAEVVAARARQKAQAVRLPAARQYASRLEEAAAAGGIDRQRADDARQAAREIEAAVAVAAADVEIATGKLAQSRSQLARLSLKAPADGTVVRLAVHAGTRVDAQSSRSLLVLLPDRPLQVRAELNESFAGAVRPGMLAEVSLDTTAGASAAPRRARVVRVSPLVGPTHLEDDGSAPRTGQRVVDCFLVFEEEAPAKGANGASAAWRVGQNVRVNFHE